MTSISKDVTLPKPLSLRRNFSWTFTANVVYAGCQLGMLMVLAKLGSPEMVGQFGLALAVTAPVMMFANLQLRAIQATDSTHERRFGDYLALRLITTITGFLVIGAITLVGGFQLETALVIMAVAAAKSFEAVSDIVYGLLQKHERMDRIARLKMTKGMVSLAAMGAAVYCTGSVVCGAAALAGVWAVTLVVLDFPSVAWVIGPNGGDPLHRCWQVPTLSRTAWIALPLGFAVMLDSLGSSIPRYFIEYHLGTRQLGIFVALGAFMLVGYTAIGASGLSASPRLAKYYADRNLGAFRRLLLKMVGIGTVVGVAGVLVAALAGRQILTILYTPEYADHQNVFFWLMVAATISYQAKLEPALIALKSFKTLLFVWIAAILCLVLLSSILLPELGLLGAAIAVLGANTIRLVLMFAAVWRSMNCIAKE